MQNSPLCAKGFTSFGFSSATKLMTGPQAEISVFFAQKTNHSPGHPSGYQTLQGMVAGQLCMIGRFCQYHCNTRMTSSECWDDGPEESPFYCSPQSMRGLHARLPKSPEPRMTPFSYKFLKNNSQARLVFLQTPEEKRSACWFSCKSPWKNTRPGRFSYKFLKETRPARPVFH